MTAEPAMSDPVARRVREPVEHAPPLTDEQRARLRALLNQAIRAVPGPG